MRRPENSWTGEEGDDVKRGKFIIFEGIEGSGKSTQAKRFYSMLKKTDRNAVITEEPWEADRIGKLIRKELREKGEERVSNMTLQLLYMANRSNHAERVIEPSLRRGNTVVQDRYWMSTVAYGSTFSKEKRLYRNYFMAMSSMFPKPDIVFFIYVKPTEAYNRILSRKGTAERFDKLGTLRELSREYRELERLYSGVWINVNGNRSVEAVGGDVMKRYLSTVSGQISGA